MVVYLDAVAVLNFLVNYLLLYATARLGAAAMRKRRLALGASLGAVYAVLVYLPPLGFLSSFFFKLTVAGGMLLAAFGAKRSTLRPCAVFAALTLALCGAVYGVQLLQGGGFHYVGKQLFFPVSFFTLLLTASAVCLACRLLLPRLNHGVNSVLPLALCLRGKRVQLSALQDSGNTLCDPVSGEKVLTVYAKAALPLFPKEYRLTAEDFQAPTSLMLRLKGFSPRLIPYRAVGISSGLLLAIPCEITLNRKNGTGLVAFSPTPLSDGGAYDALTGGY